MTTQPQPAATRPCLTWPQANARRLARGYLTTPAPDAVGLPEIAGVMLGAHAQVLSAAEVSLAMRAAPGTTRAHVRHALWTEHSLVKTYGPRGTVHLLATEDLPMWTGALSATPRPAGMRMKGTDGAVLLDADQLAAVVAAIGDALADAELTVDELTEAVAARAGGWAADRVMSAFQDNWPRWRAATAYAAHAGALCFGHNRGRKVTYTNPHRWLPGFRPLDADTALSALVRRYLHAYGPALPAHFAKWLAAPSGWANGVFEAMESAGELERVTLEAGPVEAWRVAGDTGYVGVGGYVGPTDEAGASAPAAPGVRLLPYFDAFSIASHPRELLFPGRAYERALTGGQAGNYPVLLIDGTVAGVWHQRRAGRRLHVTVEPLRALGAAHRTALEDEVARLAHIQEAEAELTVGPVTVGPHA